MAAHVADYPGWHISLAGCVVGIFHPLRWAARARLYSSIHGCSSGLCRITTAGQLGLRRIQTTVEIYRTDGDYRAGLLGADRHYLDYDRPRFRWYRHRWRATELRSHRDRDGARFHFVGRAQSFAPAAN